MKRYLSFSSLSILMLCLLFVECIPEDIALPYRIQSVTTSNATDITARKATLSGEVSLVDTDTITCGIIYGETSDLSAFKGTKVTTTAKDSFAISLSNLKADTEYYYCAYAVDEGRYKLGKVNSFRTNLYAYVSTDMATDVKAHRATLCGGVGGEVIDAMEELSCGFVYGTSSDLTVERGTRVSTTSLGKYSFTVKELKGSTTYYYRAYVVVDGEYKYGEVRSFTTKVYSAEAVDLGLSVMWASCNVGADMPEEFGGLYAWGETEEKDYYYWDSYKWGTSYDYMKKYFVGKHPDGRPVEVDYKTVLELEDDVAHVMWGDKWYMPTLDDVNELLGVCTTEWTTVNGVCGQKITGPNGNSVFFPAAGFRDDFYDTSNILECRYWSSSLSVGGFCNSARCLFFNDIISYETYEARCAGLSVRPVWRDRKDNITVITGDVTNINASGATLSGVVYNSSQELTCGFIYGITSELSAECGTMISTTSKGEYALEVTELKANITYYYCAYVIVDGEYYYGEVRSFTTEANEPVDASKTYTVNGVSFTMIGVEGGTFTMGSPDSDSEASSSEKPAHQVTLSSYYIGETEVTQALWQAVMGGNPSLFTGDLQRPVENVSWNDCQTFISKLNELTGENFRLPTEAKWEYAARGGSASKGYKYSGSNNISDVAWYFDNSPSKTHAVKTKQPNELGIYDMSGNVWEWCSDWYGSYSSSAQTNPTGPSSGSYPVLRGGSWGSGAWDCRVARRSHFSPVLGNDISGLRLVR